MELIINADDYGISREVNQGIRYCFAKNYIQQASLMVNMPFLKEAVDMAKENGYAERIGLHINLVEGEPMTDGIKQTSLCDESGRFNGSIMRGRNRFFLKRKVKSMVKQELSAQIDTYLDFGFTFCNVDSHQHAHTNLSVLFLLFSQLRKRGNFSVRLSRNIPHEAMKGMKGIYKKVINVFIVWFNKIYGNGSDIRYFGSASDYDGMQHADNRDNVVEIMVHPIMKNNLLEDSVNDFSIEQWNPDRR